MPGKLTNEQWKAKQRKAIETVMEHVTASRALCSGIGIIPAALACDDAISALKAELKKLD